MSIFEQAVHGRRLSTPHLHFHNTQLMAQFAHLAESIGAWCEAETMHTTPKGSRRGDVAIHDSEQLADIVIVCAQVAWLLGVEISETVFDLPETGRPDPPELLGRLARGLRQANWTLCAMALACLVADCAQLARARSGTDLRAVIKAKLAADEQRHFCQDAYGATRLN